MLISYAQLKEDVLLWRALSSRVHHKVGFWIDVGGYDPEIDSVTKVFSEHGWRGINIEPLPDNYQRFVTARPHDINIAAAVTDRSGEVTFHEIVGQQLSTMEARFADRHSAAGMERRILTVPAVTLTEICERHAPADIHFLKIDVEGHEGAVIAGMDFRRFRPWILVIEAAEPNQPGKPTHEEWDGPVQAAGYRFVLADGINRYYVAKEHPELFASFSLPPDDYVLAAVIREIDHLRQRLCIAHDRIAQLERVRVTA